jgi:hypothetical protein
MPLGRDPAERLALKLRARCIRELKAITDLEANPTTPSDSFIQIGVVFSSRGPGDYKNRSFDIEERSVSPDGQRINLDWQAEITVTSELDVIVQKMVGDVPFDLIKHVIGSQ